MLLRGLVDEAIGYWEKDERGGYGKKHQGLESHVVFSCTEYNCTRVYATMQEKNAQWHKKVLLFKH